MKLSGYAAPFNSRSTDLGGFVEVIAPGAFTRTLKAAHSIFFLHHHSYDKVLASTQGKTLRLWEDRDGLRFEADVVDSPRGHDIYALVKRGDVINMSFQFSVNGNAGESWRELPGGLIERTLHDINLFEVSTVARAAYPASAVSAREFTNLMQETNAARNRMLKRMMKTKLQLVA